MFNIGMGELFVIILLVLVVVGPERLPDIMREIGKYAYQLRTLVNELTDQFADELRPIQEIQQLADDLNPVKQVTKVAMDAVEPLQKTVDQVNTASSPPKVGPELIKPAETPVVKPTAAFRSAPPQRNANPMQVISQARHTTRNPAADDSTQTSDS